MKTPVHERSVGARFSAGAARYDSHARIQVQVIETLASFLPAALPHGKILEVGCGTGRLTRLLLNRFPDADIEAIDISEGMIAFSRSKFAHAPRVRWTLADARTFRSPTPYDLVVSSSALHWILELDQALINLAGLLVPGGCMAGAIMVTGTLAELQAARQAVAPGKMPRHGMPDERLLPGYVTGAGLRVAEARVESFVNIHASPAEFLEAIHEQGLTGGNLSMSGRPLHRGELRNLAAFYARHYAADDGGVRATYRAYFFRANR